MCMDKIRTKEIRIQTCILCTVTTMSYRHCREMELSLFPELVENVFAFSTDFDLTMYNLACGKKGPLEEKVL